MNRDALDEFFAKADDVLDNWHGGTDAMLCEPSKGEVDLPRGDSYYDQRTYWRPERSWTVEVETESGWQYVGQTTDSPHPVSFAGYVAAIQQAYAAAGRRYEEWREQWLNTYGFPQRYMLGADLTPAVFDFDETHECDETPAQRALRLRRERNTGPDDPRRLDGRRTRRRTATTSSNGRP